MTSSTSASRWHALVATSTQARARKTATDHHENEKRKAIQVSAAILYASTRLLRDLQDSEEQYSTNNNAESTPAAPAHSWRYNAMYAATFTLSALLSYITIEAMRKRGRGRN